MIARVERVTVKSSDLIKWIMVVILLMAGVIADFYFVQVTTSIKMIAWIILLIVTGVVASFTELGKTGVKFAIDSRMELRKVVWPTREETVRTTLVVMVLVLVIALLLWAIDSGLIFLISWLTGQRG